MMEIRGISSSMPLPGIRQAAESAPVLPSTQNLEQVTAEAVKQPAGTEKAAAGRKVAYPEKTPFEPGLTARNEMPEAVARVKEAMESIAKSLDSLSQSSGLQFSIDDELGRVVVKVVDPETSEVIKQFPSEDAIALAKSLGKIRGNLHQAKA